MDLTGTLQPYKINGTIRILVLDLSVAYELVNGVWVAIAPF